jgi:glycosyltransferase involved in cell wall biosynthesis
MGMGSKALREIAAAVEPLVSVIVPVFNDREGIRRCLTALDGQTLEAEHFEVVVVDNGSDESIEDIVAEYPFATLLLERTPGSYVARNAGARIAKSALLAFTDADCVPTATWLNNAVRFLEYRTEVDAVGGPIQLEVGREPSIIELYQKLFDFLQERYVRESKFAATANMVCRSGAFHRTRGFDERLKSSGDREWGQRLAKSGSRLEYCDDAVVNHRPRSTISALIRKKRRLVAGHASVPELPREESSGHSSWVDSKPRGLQMAVHLLCSPQCLGLNYVQGIGVLGIGAVLFLVGAGERLRLRLGGSALR